MRISDWSSDVCSSDLLAEARRRPLCHRHHRRGSTRPACPARRAGRPAGGDPARADRPLSPAGAPPGRSTERRVGKEWVSTRRYRRLPSQQIKKTWTLYLTGDNILTETVQGITY